MKSILLNYIWSCSAVFIVRIIYSSGQTIFLPSAIINVNCYHFLWQDRWWRIFLKSLLLCKFYISKEGLFGKKAHGNSAYHVTLVEVVLNMVIKVRVLNTLITDYSHTEVFSRPVTLNYACHHGSSMLPIVLKEMCTLWINGSQRWVIRSVESASFLLTSVCSNRSNPCISALCMVLWISYQVGRWVGWKTGMC